MPGFVKELKKLKEHINSKNFVSSNYESFDNAPSDNVYKSNTMLEYHIAFGSNLFIKFQALYERLMLLKKEQAGKIWNDFYSRINLIKNSERIDLDSKHKEINKTRIIFIKSIDVNLSNTTIILAEIEDIKRQIKNLDLEPFY